MIKEVEDIHEIWYSIVKGNFRIGVWHLFSNRIHVCNTQEDLWMYVAAPMGVSRAEHESFVNAYYKFYILESEDDLCRLKYMRELVS